VYILIVQYLGKGQMMFYIEKHRHRRRKDLTLIHIGPTLIVFVAFFGLSIWSSIDASHTNQDNRAQIATRHVEQTQATIQERLTRYEDILRAGAGFFGGSDNVTRDEWKHFVDTFELNKRYPGILAAGYIPVVDSANLGSFLEQARNQGLPDYSVHPSGERTNYAPVLYIEPMNAINQKAVGYDMLSEASRKRALELARDSGQTTITDTVILAQDSQTVPQPALLIYMPLYDHAGIPPTTDERRAHLTGYTYAPFRVQEFFSKIEESKDSQFGFEIKDLANPNAPLYQSPSFSKLSQASSAEHITNIFQVNNRKWTITGVVDPNVITAQERTRPASVFWGGLLFSIFVAGFIYLLLLNRTRILTHREDREINDVKDELLALASHQLRTPATGVKQYIGMLREGYAGELNEEQMKYLDKAYASNERQLSTINEMLFVARADAGNIELIRERFDLTSLVRDIIDEHGGAITERRQVLSVKLPKQKLFVYADTRYVRMAIENVLSNATKYTPEEGSITIMLDHDKNNARLVIKDTGVGVSKKDYDLLFQKFARIPNELTNKVTGSGIGLYLAKKVVEAHHGEINFLSEVGVGSTCSITLPLRKNKAK
jgi:signal transduction histidine kinase